jgi:hypothetical protein
VYRQLLRGSALPVTLYLLLASATLTASDYSEPRAPCRNYNPQNNLYWGDLHVHTRYSLDAATQATRTTPAQAYDFARGGELGIQPWRDGLPLRTLQLERPLDFAAVTDHAELLGEVVICADESLEGYDSFYCRAWRWSPRAAFFLFNMAAAGGRHPGFCGENGERCRAAAAGPWQEMQAAAEAAYDRSPECSFTSFVAYEWTGASGGLQNSANIHRNVIFRNAEVPELPTSFIDSREQVSLLYRQLDEACLDAEGACDVLVIPHNSNLSNGNMFRNRREDGEPLTAADADTRRRFETLVELLQHKGSSECYFEAGVSEDELCATAPGWAATPFNSVLSAAPTPTSAQRVLSANATIPGTVGRVHLPTRKFPAAWWMTSSTTRVAWRLCGRRRTTAMHCLTPCAAGKPTPAVGRG